MKGPAVLWYTILRLLLIVVPLAILLVLHVNFIVAVFAATFIGLCLSYILLARLRHRMASGLYERMHRAKPARSEDDDAEDAFVDAALLKEEGAGEPGESATSNATVSTGGAPEAAAANRSEDHAEGDA
ncbi:MAG TPA: DUF4229 domain-containing protein [Microbacteriaceae bacterium]|nr:DUF4229 domain-containing protein [Microbacteriaceae bacterium]